MEKLLIILPIVLALFACNQASVEPEKDPEEQNTTPSYTIDQESKMHVFGFSGQNRYAYCPSIVKDSNEIHLYFCGNPQPDEFVDNIYYINIDEEGNQSEPKSVLQPGPAGTWDSQHTCDPSVIAMDYTYKGEHYNLIMFYLGTDKVHHYNEIGVAFAKNYGGKWVKYEQVLIEKTWATEDDLFIPGTTVKAWGVGQPSALVLDKASKQVLLTYTIGDGHGTRVVYRKLDFSSSAKIGVGSAVKVYTKGLRKLNYDLGDFLMNTEIAYSKKDDAFVIVRPVHPFSNDYPDYIASVLEIDMIGREDFFAGTGRWRRIVRIDESITGFPRNHNAGLLKDKEGHIGTLADLQIYYTVSKASPDVAPAPGEFSSWTNNIWKIKIVNKQNKQL